MKNKLSNIERAKSLMKTWPKWQQDYTLTKYATTPKYTHRKKVK
jgi:hypothetical protein